MDLFTEEFMIATENRFKKFMMVSIAGLKKDYHRKESKRTEQELLFYSPELYFENIMHHYDEIFTEDILETNDEYLMLALQSLTEKQMQILQLLVLNDLTEMEVAKILNISQQRVNRAKNTVKKRIIEFRQRSGEE